VSLKIGSSVIVYDNNVASGTILYNGVISTNAFTNQLITPPPLTSTGRSLYVVFFSNNFVGQSFKGFRGQYQSNSIGSVGVGSGRTLLSMSSIIDLTPPGNGLQYTQGINYIWSIQPQYTTGSITFVFSHLKLINATDTLTIYDGSTQTTVLAQFTNTLTTPNKWITTKSTSATVVFSSTNTIIDSNHNGNFKLSYFSDGPNYHCGFTTNPASLSAQSMSLTDGSPSGSPVYPFQYCVWLITPRDSNR
jgi:hypothetical protein